MKSQGREEGLLSALFLEFLNLQELARKEVSAVLSIPA